jgi:hypothetical protein
VKSLILFGLVVGSGACSWTQFDDLADQTPARGTEKPDGVKSSDYGVIVVGATSPTATTGGTIGVLSTGPGNFSTLELDGGGVAQNLGDSEPLGQHTIDSLTGNATLLFDGNNQIVLVDNSNVGTVIAIQGTADGLSVDQQVGTSAHPIATTFVNGELVVAVEPAASMPNVFAVKGTAVVSCTLKDNAGMPLAAAAIAIDGTKLWAYAKTGAFFGYDLAALDAAGTCTGISPNTAVAMAGAAANGGHIDVVPGKFAIVTAFDIPSTMAGAVQVIALPGVTTVGTAVAAMGVKSAAFDTFDGQGVVVLGYPYRNVGTTTSPGAVDLHRLDITTGALDANPAETLTVPNADANHLFGRSVTTTKYNGKPIIVAAASNVVYSYYATSLYTKR